MSKHIPPSESKSWLTRRAMIKSTAVTLLAAVAIDTASAVGGALNTVRTTEENQLLPPLPVDAVLPKIAKRACEFDPADVRLTQGPFLDAQNRDGAYLLRLDPDRFLHSFQINAGLPPKAPSYGGWESSGIAGHVGGHYLSACSMMYRATGDRRYRERSDYMVAELARCQAQSADGLVTAIPGYRDVFARISATGHVTGWVPWYNMHKLFAGLRDTYLYCGNKTAREVFLKLADWAINVTSGLTDAQLQAMLDSEHGGMAESAADAYAMTGDARYLDLVRRFTHHAIMDPLAAGRDELDGHHSNTNIPKMIGYERVYELTGEKPYHDSAVFFWQTVVANRSYANGGNGDHEYFFPPAQFGQHLSSDDQTETCCSYNMLKLTSQHFQKDPNSAYADYAERTMLNHILASQEPVQGMMCYFTPMEPGHFRVYNDPENAMWCCVGTGIENHARYGTAIYYHSADRNILYINQYIASTLDWREIGVKLRQDTTMPDSENVRLTVTADRQTRLTVKLRKPFWASAMTVAVNGKTHPINVGSDGYASINRLWKTGDFIELRLPMSLRLEELPNTPNKCVVMYGPVLLASPMGRSGMDKLPDITTDQHPYGHLPGIDAPVFIGERAEAPHRFIPVKGETLTFRSSALGVPNDVTLMPFFRLHHQRYNLYWSIYTDAEWEAVKAAKAAEEMRQRELDKLTIDVFEPGNQQSEIDHKLQSSNSRTGVAMGRSWRDADSGSFSFVMKVDSTAPLELLCTYWGGDSNNRLFDVIVDGTVIATQRLESLSPGKFVDVGYVIPSSVIAGKTSVTVTFKSKPGATAGGLFGCRIIQAVTDSRSA